MHISECFSFSFIFYSKYIHKRKRRPEGSQVRESAAAAVALIPFSCSFVYTHSRPFTRSCECRNVARSQHKIWGFLSYSARHTRYNWTDRHHACKSHNNPNPEMAGQKLYEHSSRCRAYLAIVFRAVSASFSRERKRKKNEGEKVKNRIYNISVPRKIQFLLRSERKFLECFCRYVCTNFSERKVYSRFFCLSVRKFNSYHR